VPPPAPDAARLRGRLHQVCAVAAVPAAVSVTRLAAAPAARRAAAAYGAGLVTLFTVSAAYHRGRWSPGGRRALKRLDHAAIYAFAATSYGPLGLVLPPGPRRILRSTAWTAAGAGAAVKAVRLDADGGLADALYLVTGWAGLLVLPALLRALTPRERALLLGGGVVYTAGAAVLVRRRPDPAPDVFGYHELGHLVMLGGTVLHHLLHRSVLQRCAPDAA
jgi:hemolysin III